MCGTNLFGNELAGEVEVESDPAADEVFAWAAVALDLNGGQWPGANTYMETGPCQRSGRCARLSSPAVSVPQ
jgi:hypothetical protein